MSGNGGEGVKVKTDRRVLRTRDTLGDALMELLQEKTFDEITVQEVLDKAGVGRSTFYEHYSDKSDLFLSDVEDFWEMMAGMLTRRGAAAERVAPVEEMFAHVANSPQVLGAMRSSGKLSDVMALGQGFFARSIAERLRMAGVEMEAAEMAGHAAGLAGGMFALLDWWIGHGMRETPGEMDAMFHRMVWRGVGRRGLRG